MSAFGITPASTSVPLDDARRATASFTVSNETGHVVRVRVSVSSDGPGAADPAWLSIRDRPERQLDVQASDRFSVDIAVPDGVPGGTYRFRLDAVSVDLPDEEWAHGPAVAFVVPAAPVVEDVEPEVVEVAQPRGYVPASVGALLGGLAGVLVGGLLGLLLAAFGLMPSGNSFSTATGTSSGSFGDALGEAIGEALAGGFAAAIAILFATLLLAFLGLWIGTSVGSFIGLRMRQLDGRGSTAIVLAVAFPFWAVVVIVVLGAIGGAFSNDIVGLILLLAFVPAATIPLALVARALYRFRKTGGL